MLTDDAGAVVYNLAQQDMLAMRVTMRAAFAVGNPITRATAAAGRKRYPFAVLQNVTP